MKTLSRRSCRLKTLLSLVLMYLTFGMAAGPSPWPPIAITQEIQAALDHISPDSMRGHLSFISSDLLEGRDTPSRGLDIAAEYIAAQFRRAGLEPVGDDGYFQTANWLVQNSNHSGFKLELTNKGELKKVRSADAEWTNQAAIDLPATPLIKLSYDDQSASSSLTAERVQGKAIITEIPDYRAQPRERRREVFTGVRQFMERMAQLKPALIVSVSREPVLLGAKGRLIDPEHRQQGRGLQAPGPIITIHGAPTAKFYDALKAGDTGATVSAHIATDVEQPVKVRNVVGLLRGSDPKFNKTYVLVTAHYDHLGINGAAAGDRIYNGANDDGSGTVSVIEIASALAALKTRPRRSILFMTFFGEEKGELGSRYYGAHPIFPIGDTVADINLEQVGRTDSTEGPKIASASMTGYDFSDIGEIFKHAGKQVGIDVYKHPVNSDAYFGRSDNQALAYQGVPAHTLCVAFDYPDYHGVGDEWPKIDYENMAKVDRMVGLGLLTIAHSEKTPEWNQGNPKASQYVKAWQAHHKTR